MGNIVFKKSGKGEVIIAQRPSKSNREPSEAQKAQRERFARANEYAKAAMADSTIRLHYEALTSQQNKSLYQLALSDHLKGTNLLNSLSFFRGDTASGE